MNKKRFVLNFKIIYINKEQQQNFISYDFHKYYYIVNTIIPRILIY